MCAAEIVSTGCGWQSEGPMEKLPGSPSAMFKVPEAVYHTLSGGDLFSEASEVSDLQTLEMARPPRLERGTLCLEGAYGPCIYRQIMRFS